MYSYKMFQQIFMRKNLVALGIFLGTILYAAIWMRILDFVFNYREIKTYEGFLLFSIMFFVFYQFGIYINAVIFKLYLKANKDIVPSAIVNSIKENNHITDKVGHIKFVAPTKGRNLPIDIGASSGPTSQLTLEVVGEKGTGIAYLTTWGGSIHGLYFKYQGKKTKLWGSVKLNTVSES